MPKKKTTKRATKKRTQRRTQRRSQAKGSNGPVNSQRKNAAGDPTITPLVRTCQIQLEAVVDRGGDEPEKGVIRLTHADLDQQTATRIREIAKREAMKSQQQQG